MRYPARVELFRQGEPPESVFLLEQGLIKLMRVESGGTEIIVGMRSAGWFLGAASVILDRPYLVSAVTVTGAQVSRIDAEAFRERLRSDPKLSWHLHEMHSREVHSELDHVTEFNSMSARRRLEGFLQRLEEMIEPTANGDPAWLVIPLRQWEIAQLIGVTPPYLSELTRELEEQGILRRERDCLMLCRRDRVPVPVPVIRGARR